FAIVSGDSDFIPLVNKLKEFGKTVFVVGGKAFTSTILQQNCHEFISFESLLDEPRRQGERQRERDQHRDRDRDRDRDRGERRDRPDGQQGHQQRQRPAPLDLAQAMPLVERALQVLERRNVQAQLGLLKSTMLQLDPAFSERAYGCGSFSEFVEKLKKADYVNVSGAGGRYVIERKTSAKPVELPKPEEALPALRDVLENHRLEIEDGVLAEDLEGWMRAEVADFDPKKYGYQEFAEFLNFAQDKTVVRIEADEEKGLVVFLGAEFYPPAPLDEPEKQVTHEYDEVQPIVAGQPSMVAPTPPLEEPKPMKKPRAPRKRAAKPGEFGVMQSPSDKPPRKRTPRKKLPQ
ncbi:MAG TPA: OST-HTH/LOTUS domain-containing protein, partial [Bryobacteraceae bacterium]|nr:OST-HTH/LOTUS domain-containing protein [Bryobacteraceae bacterium]